jgi:hypothetical protein
VKVAKVDEGYISRSKGQELGYLKARCPKCCYAECHNAECRGTDSATVPFCQLDILST